MLKMARTRSAFIFAFMLIAVFAVPLAAQEASNDIWIDVRSPQEFKQGHLDEAINIPFMQIMQQITEVTKDKQSNIRLYCTVGTRAQIAKQILDSMGYENVVNEGGLKDIKQ